MSENDWDVVLRNTHYLNGHRLVFAENTNGTKSFRRIDRAPYTGICNGKKDVFIMTDAHFEHLQSTPEQSMSLPTNQSLWMYVLNLLIDLRAPGSHTK